MPPRKKKNRPALPPARRVALAAVHACLSGQDAQASLDAALKSTKDISAKDAGLATELVYGTLRNKLRLDHILSRFLSNPQGIPPRVSNALAVAAYEILHLDRVPAYASVDWSVEFAKSINPKFGKLVNAVLRRVADTGAQALSEAFLSDDSPKKTVLLERMYSCPGWIVENWLHAYGEDTARHYLKAQLSAPPLGLRIRGQHPGAEDLMTTLRGSEHCVSQTESGIALETAPDNLEAILHSGMAVRQSLAGQKAVLDLGLEDWDSPVWDACSGRGGKAMMVYDTIGGPVFASDVSRPRLKGLASERTRLNLQALHILRARSDQSAPFKRPLPTVLVDAPCSGLGVLARRPDAKYKRTPQDVAQLAAVQQRILKNASEAVAAGGRLVYLTCTTTPEENEQAVEAFLQENNEFRLTRTHATAPDSPLGEFFFGALLTRK